MDNIINFNFLKVADNKKKSDNSEISIDKSNFSKEKATNVDSFIIKTDKEKELKTTNINPEFFSAEEINKNSEELNEEVIKTENINEFAVSDSNLFYSNENKENTKNFEVFSKLGGKKKSDILTNENQKNAINQSNFIKTNKKKNPIQDYNIIQKPEKKIIDSMLSKKDKSNSFKELFSNIKKENKSRIKSLFQNYVNYIAKRRNAKSGNIEKVILANKVKINPSNYDKNLNIKNENILLTKEKEKNKIKVNVNDNSPKESINNNFKLSSDKSNTEFSKEHSIQVFDRLKNIIDIKSTDAGQKFVQLLENNIKLNNNKFEIQLRPENLGRLQISLEIIGENVDITINSDNINTAQSLVENNSNLSKMLQNHGMNLNNFNFNGNNSKNKDKGNNIEKKIEENKGITNNKEEDIKLENKNKSEKLVYVKA